MHHSRRRVRAGRSRYLRRQRHTGHGQPMPKVPADNQTAAVEPQGSKVRRRHACTKDATNDATSCPLPCPSSRATAGWGAGDPQSGFPRFPSPASSCALHTLPSNLHGGLTEGTECRDILAAVPKGPPKARLSSTSSAFRMPLLPTERMFVSREVVSELPIPELIENRRRSVAMLTPDVPAHYPDTRDSVAQ